jgi:hypothetical protein
MGKTCSLSVIPVIQPARHHLDANREEYVVSYYQAEIKLARLCGMATAPPEKCLMILASILNVRFHVIEFSYLIFIIINKKNMNLLQAGQL